MSPRSISRLALRAMAIRLFIVVLLSSIGGYWYNYQIFKDNIVKELEKYTLDRTERETLRFNFAEKNLKILGDAFIQKLNGGAPRAEEHFNSIFEKLPDKTFRQKDLRDNFQTQFFFEEGFTPTPQIKKNLSIADQLLNNFGYAWSSMFINVWLVSDKKYAALFWPKRPEIMKNAPKSFKFETHEWVTMGFPENNPSQQVRWSGPYHDELTNDWVISVNYPFYFKNEFQFSLAMDVELAALYRRTMKNSIADTYHIIFRDDGRLIIHPELMEKIAKADGHYFINEQEPKILEDIYGAVRSSDKTIVYDDKNDLILAKGKIKGPDWWFVVVYPKTNLEFIARRTGLFVALIGFLSLLVELIMLRQVLQKYVALPIHKLIDATSRITRGDAEVRVEVSSEDEIGHLAESFNTMGDKIMERDHKLIEQASVLETQVKERTTELDAQRAKSYQAAKMATLGEMAGGIAHEINNPLAIISMSTEALTKQIKAKNVDEDKLLAYTQRVQRTTERIARVVRGMKSFSRDAGNDPKKTTAVEDIITNTLTLCEQTLESSDIYLTVASIPDVKVYCREIEIIQALMNLIQNSVDALENRLKKIINIQTKIIGKNVQIIVEDSGPQIPDGVADRLMTPFFTTKEVGKGVGLGLFTSNGLIQSNGGRLFLDRTSPGTKFIIELPIEVTH